MYFKEFYCITERLNVNRVQIVDWGGGNHIHASVKLHSYHIYAVRVRKLACVCTRENSSNSFILNSSSGHS